MLGFQMPFNLAIQPCHILPLDARINSKIPYHFRLHVITIMS